MAEIGEMRAQRLEACERDDPSTCGKTITLPTNRKGIVSVHGPCDGCNRDGTHWVTVGRLVADEDTDFSYMIEKTP